MVANDTAPIMQFGFTLVPAIQPDELHANMRSSIARGLPAVRSQSLPNTDILSIAGGGPSLADTYRDLTGCIAAVNGSLQFLLDKGVVPHICGVCDPSPHMVDIVTADPRVTYFVESCVNPKVYDKLLAAGCTVYRWNASSIPGGMQVLNQIEPDWFVVGGGSTMGLRWLGLGYALGFRHFDIHGLDSSFRIDPERGKASHAYPDHQDKKDWIGFDGFQTRVNFIGQVQDFLGWLERMKDDDAEAIDIRMFGTGLLQTKFAEWRERNPGWHRGAPKPEFVKLTSGFRWPETDQFCKSATEADVRSMDLFLGYFVGRRSIAVQAGGNVGVYAAHLARHFRFVHTFEPDPTNYECLAENIKKVSGNIIAHHAALGDRYGTTGVANDEPWNAGAVRVSGEGAIPMLRLDDMDLPACDLIWLDIEGYELKALEGAEQTIERCQPAVIIELGRSEKNHGIPTEAASEWLMAHGYIPTVKAGNDMLYLPTGTPS